MKPIKPKNFVHIITGDGKGKTTAALGLALRAIGAGKKVIIIQFMKKPDFSEYKAIKKYQLPIEIESYGLGFYKILGDKRPPAAHKKAAQKALRRAKDAIASQKYDLIILDEINVAVSMKLINIDELLSLIDLFRTTDNSQRTADLILTGRNAHPKIKRQTDLISDIKKIKHYFDRGINARKGIEF